MIAKPSSSVSSRLESRNALDEGTRCRILDSLARSDAEVARLTNTVGRLVGKLVELGVDDRKIGTLLREGSTRSSSSKECPLPRSSVSSNAGSSTEVTDSHLTRFASKEPNLLYMLASTSSSSSQLLNLASPLLLPPQRPSTPTLNHASQRSEPTLFESGVNVVLPSSSFSSFTTSNLPSLNSKLSPTVDLFNLPPTSDFTPCLDAEMLRSALNLSHQPVSPPFFDFDPSPFAQSDTFLLGNSAPPTHQLQQPLQQQQSLEQTHLTPNLPSTQDSSYLHTLFELHSVYLTSRRQYLTQSTVSDSAVKELQLAILRLLAATSDQRDAYLSLADPLSPEDQAFLSTANVDERLMLLPTRPIIKLIFGKTTTPFDCAMMVAEIIEAGRIFGDVCDITGWTMPASFLRNYKFDVPPELAGICTEVDPSTIPFGLRGATIREIVLKTEKSSGWRTAGPFPIVAPPQSVWEQSIWEQERNEGGKSPIFC